MAIGSCCRLWLRRSLSKGKEKETGYMAEEWHLRYVGKEAKDIAASGLSLEEYYGFEGGDYVD